MSFLFKIIVSAILIVGIVNPKLAWEIFNGLKLNYIKPNKLHLLILRAGSFIILVFLWLAYQTV